MIKERFKDSTERETAAQVQVVVEGRKLAVPAGTTALEAIRLAGLDVPTLCHDPRLEPSGACRACLVKVEGYTKFLTACALPVTDGMNIQVDSPELREARRAVLRMLARDYPMHYVQELPEKEFHRYLTDFGLLEHSDSDQEMGLVDNSNPYFRYDPNACIDCYRCVRVCSELQGANVWEILDRGGEVKVVPLSLMAKTGSLCKSCGACSDACPTGALVDKSRIEQGRADTWTRTTCPYCGVGCELWAGTKDGRIVQNLPVLDSPVNKGHLCVKGRYAHAFVHAPDRLTAPLIRKNGVLVESSWGEAIRFVADAFKKILATDGPDAIGVLGSARAPNEDNYMAQKFARVVLGTNNVDCCARVCHGPTAAAMKAMLGTGAATNSFDDIELAQTILVSGSNSTECHPVVGDRIVQAKRRGANLIVIDPRRTELASHADVHVQLRPGTNIPLLHAMAHTLFEEGLADEKFLKERVAEAEAFRAFVADYSPETVAPICGVPAETIRAAARLYASERPSMCFHGLGMTEHVQGTEGVMCLVNLALITGNIGKAGTGINPLRGQNNVQGSAHMGCEPSNLTGFVSIEDGAERFENVWNAPVPRNAGMNLMKMLDAASEGRLKAMWLIGYDVYFTHANASATRKAFESMDCVVVQDLFLNESAREFAHVVLPACSSFERDGTFMNAERRVSRVRKAVDPVGQSKPDWAIVQLVAQAMGHAKGFSFNSEADIWDEVRKVWTPGAGMSYARLEKHGLQWPCPNEEHPGTTILHQKEFPIGKQATLKRIEYFPSPEVTTEDFPFLLHTGRSIFHFNAGTMTMRTRNRDIRRTDTLDIHPADAERLHLVDGMIVKVESRYGTADLPVRIDRSLREGEVFSTFHDPLVFVNELTSPNRDRIVGAPEYKLTAVRIGKV